MLNKNRIKIYLIIISLFVILFTISGSYATYDNTTNLNNCSDSNYDTLTYPENNDLLTKTYTLKGGKFSDIQKTINKANSGDKIQLSGDFHATDNESMIMVGKKLTITSTSSATLDGRDLSGILYLRQSAKGSVISNLHFTNGYRFAASAMFIDAKDITIDNCVFEDNHGFGNGGGLLQHTGIKTVHQV